MGCGRCISKVLLRKTLLALNVNSRYHGNCHSNVGWFWYVLSTVTCDSSDLSILTDLLGEVLTSIP